MMILFIFPALLLLTALARARHNNAVVLLAALLPSYLLRFSLFDLPTNFLEFGIYLVFFVGLIGEKTRRQWLTVVRRLPRLIIVFTILFLLAAIMSTIISPHHSTSIGILKGWIIAPCLLGFMSLATASQSARARRQIIKALLASALFVAILGLVQIFSVDRIRSIYDVPGSLALFLTPLAALTWWRRSFFTAVILTSAIIATQSLSAIIALTGSLFLGLVLLSGFASPAPRRRRDVDGPLVLATILLLAVTYLSSTGRLAYLAQPLTSKQPNSISVRLQLWPISLDLIKENPITGIGLGTFEPAYQQKLHERFQEHSQLKNSSNNESQITNHPPMARPLAEFVYRDPHSWPLSFYLNTGLLGVVSFTVLNFIIIRQNIRTHHRTSQALLIALFAILIHGLAETIFWKNDLAALYWVIFALLIVSPRPNSG